MDRAERLIAAFEVFDDKKTGKIPTKSLANVLTQFGKPLSQEEIGEFVSDADRNGFVDYKQFVRDVLLAAQS